MTQANEESGYLPVVASESTQEAHVRRKLEREDDWIQTQMIFGALLRLFFLVIFCATVFALWWHYVWTPLMGG